MKKILMLEDDITFSVMLKTWLSKRGFAVDCASTVAEAKKMVDSSYDIVLSDLRLPDEDGICLLSWMKESGYDVPFVVMTSYAEVQSAVNSMKLGAFDFIAKPINPDELYNKIKEALAQREASHRISKKRSVPFGDYVPGKSDVSRKLHEYIRLVAPTNMAVLLSGENGSGKGVVARQIHIESGRKKDGFVAVDCTSLSKDSAAVELFGCADTDPSVPKERRLGYFRMADGGTLFLGGVESLPESVLPLISQVLRDRLVRPVGTDKTYPVDVRLVSSTSLESAAISSLGELYHQVNEFSIAVPTLRERKGDIMLYADYFLEVANEELGKEIVGFDKEAIAILLDYAWPGNLRQLKNVVNRVALLAKTQFISSTLLPEELLHAKKADDDSDGWALRDSNSEKRKILKALKDCNNNKSQAAALLQIDRKTLYNKMRQLGIFE
ncbi:MAG: sigma-54-dependent Fis family transcriptional regulator [Paludibacteraceae bacterium]|nr:sigma-54-dependent Fis family transcriptional regulator [Paludibacteraceae bacterium]MBR4841382.1 sigma-54-dependent Fis family transcriptional regulator [Paludibacteraceae bacterium]